MITLKRNKAWRSINSTHEPRYPPHFFVAAAMGCCASSPHARRHHRLAHRRRARDRDPADLDECYVPEDELPLYRGGRPSGREPCSECSTSSSHVEDANATRPPGLHVPLRTFGRYRPNSVWVPDDIGGLPSTHLDDGRYLPTDPDQLCVRPRLITAGPFDASVLSTCCGCAHPCGPSYWRAG